MNLVEVECWSDLKIVDFDDMLSLSTVFFDKFSRDYERDSNLVGCVLQSLDW
jgi:hypothetical protein